MTQAEHHAFNALAVGILALDKDYIVRAWNRRLTEWTGLEASALVGTDIRLWFGHLRTNDFRDAFRAIWQTPELVILDSLPTLIPSFTQGSTQRVLTSSAGHYVSSDGESVALFTLQDITPQARELEHFRTSIVEIEEAWRNDEEIRLLNEELEKRVGERTEELAREIAIRKQAEEAFRNSEHLLSLIFENAAVGLALLHKNGRYIRLNQMFCRLFGYNVEELLGKHFSYLYDEYERDEANARWHEIINGETGLLSGERHFQLRNGSSIDIYFSTVRFFTADGEVRVITTGTDISSVKQAQEEMRQALLREQELNKLKANFVAAVSHEFRTPLTVIFSSSEILHLQQNMVPEKREKMHYQIERSVKRMTELLDEVVFIERSMRERTIAFPRPVNIMTLVSDIVQETEVFDQAKHGIEVQYRSFEGDENASNPAYTLMLDVSLMRPIISHILVNALKFSATGTNVRLRFERSAHALVFYCYDNGVGIPEEEVESIYDLFFRASNVGIAQGTGMGLNIVKRCVDAHGGTIVCDSRLGIGTTFRIQIPLS